jgi:hypothetical protein
MPEEHIREALAAHWQAPASGDLDKEHAQPAVLAGTSSGQAVGFRSKADIGRRPGKKLTRGLDVSLGTIRSGRRVLSADLRRSSRSPAPPRLRESPFARERKGRMRLRTLRSWSG